MKKIYLLFLFACLSFFAQAQVKGYAFDSKNFNEETIEQITEESRKNGTQEWEVQILKQSLLKRLAKQRQGIALGNNNRGAIPQVQAACTNVGFENGNYSGWTLTSGDILSVNLPCNICATNTGGIAAITTTVSSGATWTNGIDNCSGQSAVAPGGGTYSLLLNNKSSGGKMQELKQTFLVTSSNNIFTFQYLAVLEDGGHPANEQPYFSVQMSDQNNNVIPCTYVLQSAAASINGWTACPGCPGANYKGWVTVTLDLTAYINQNVTMQYIVSDCNQGGHYGYAYVDGDCGQLSYNNTASICSGNSANLCGPPGYLTYTWTGPQTGNAQCLNTSTVGTYTLATTSSLGCPSPTLIYTVSPNPAPVPTFSVGQTACNLSIHVTDQSTVSSGSISNWSWTFGDGSGAVTSTTPGNTQNHTYTVNGTYNVVMTCTTSAGCVGSFTVPVTISASLNTNISTAAVNCNGGSNGTATVTPSGGSGVYTYTWSPSGGNNSSASGLSAGNYTVAVSDGAGCNTTTVVTVSQPTAVSATTSFTAATCGQSNGSAGVNASGGTSPYTYTWTPTGGNNATSTAVTAGNYTCTIADAHGCLHTAAVTVGNNPGPAASIVSSVSVTCNGGTNGAAVANATGGTNPLTYSWSPSGGNNATATNLSAGNYTCTVTDANGCTTNTIVTITQATAIVPTSSVSSTACGSSNGSATVTPTGGTPGYTYSWTPSGGNASSASGLSAGVYSCTVTDANGCSKVATVFITTSTGPTATLTASSSVTCNGGSNGSATVNAAGVGTLTYNWSPSGGSAPTATNIPSGVFTCVITDGNGCITTTTVSIAQPSAITTVLTTTNVSCNGNTNGIASVNASGGTGALTYTWVPSGGNAATTSALAAGTYTCIIKDANGCPAAVIATLTQPTAVVAGIASNSVACNGNATGTATVTASGGSGPYSYVWAPSGGSASTATGLGAGTYTCAVADLHGCLTSTITTIAQPALLATTGGGTDISCNGGHNGTATVTPTGGTPAYTYSWTPSGGSTAIASNLPVGNYTCSIKDANGCLTNTVITITQPTVLAGTYTVTQAPCSGGNGSITASVSGGTPGYVVTWNTVPPQTGNTATNLPEGSYTVTITDANGCSKKKTVSIGAPQPKDSLQALGTLCSTDPNVLLSAPQGGTAPNNITGPYQWYNNNSIIAGANGTTYSASTSTVNVYSVTWFYNGCRYTTTTITENVYVDVSSLPQVNIFTPNDDKINDEFVPFALGNQSPNYLQQIATVISDYELFVYDRWGILMFHSTDLTNAWDGKNAPDGTYFWIANYKTKCNSSGGTQQKIKGYVQLLK